MRSPLGALLVIELLLGIGCAAPPRLAHPAARHADQVFCAPAVSAESREVDARSLYLPMDDGVRLAMDVLTPRPLSPSHRIPALLKISRLGRAPQDGRITDEDRFWVEHGYARILVDERGTGASFGTSRYGSHTIADLRTMVDWIVAQPWSNGRAGAIGVSVEGTAAEFLASSGHPAVRAVAPWFSDYNYYTDVVRPGGVYNEFVMRNFGEFTQQMDRGESAKGVTPDTATTATAIAEHRNNIDLYTATRRAEFSDDPVQPLGNSLVEISPAHTTAALRRARVPILVYASWFDAGTAQGALQRYRDLPHEQQVYIGPWSHGAVFDANPFAAPDAPRHPSTAQQRFEALRFFDRYVGRGEQPAILRGIHYYTVGENAWHFTARWPPAGLSVRSYHLGERGLVESRASSPFALTLGVVATGESNRWRTQFGGGDVLYEQSLASMRDAASLTSTPLATSLEITGHPRLHVRLMTSHDDPSLLAYLFAVDAEGRGHYLTEGALRIIHRRRAEGEPTLHTYRRVDALPIRAGTAIEAEILLLPISAVVPHGSRLCLLLAGGDISTFATAGAWDARLDPSSRLDLPSRPRPDLDLKDLQ